MGDHPKLAQTVDPLWFKHHPEYCNHHSYLLPPFKSLFLEVTALVILPVDVPVLFTSLLSLSSLL